MKQSDINICLQFPKMFSIVFITTCIVALQGNTAAAFTSPASRIGTRVNTNANVNAAQHRPTWANNMRSIKPNLTTVSMTMTTNNGTSETNVRKRHVPKLLANVYINYITKLWKQTDPEEREKVAAKQALSAIQRVKHIMEGEEYIDLSHVNDNDTLDDIDARIEAKDELLAACAKMLECMEKAEMQAPAMEINDKEAKELAETTEKAIAALKKKKNSRSVLFGAAMGAIVAFWVFSGNFVFTTLFTLMTALGQLEYYRMVMKTGIYPARRISVLGACSMFITVS